jgi:hypothetical protein
MDIFSRSKSMSDLTLILQPFIWIKPRFEKTVCDSVIFFGPFRIKWSNSYE